MKRSSIARVLLVLHGLGLAVPLPSLAAKVSGSNTLRVETYEVTGDERYSPYPDEGTYFFNDLHLNAKGSTSPGRNWQFDFAGTITNSPYRSDYNGLVPEAVHLSYEDTVSALPFRVDFGDQNVQFSELTLSRTLKAARLTLRPNSGHDGRDYWVSGVVGSNGQQWREFDADADLYQGVSAGIRDRELGSYSVNLVHNSRDVLAGLPSVSQWVASLTAQRQFDVAGQDLALKGEVAHFRGDAASPALDEQEGYGYYLQLDGKSQTRPLDYRLRYDRYSSEFRPNGSAAPADSEAMLAEGGWRFDSGIQLRGRLQRSRTGLSTPDPLQTDSAGLSVSGPLLPSQPNKITGKLDLAVQQRESDSGDSKGLAKTAQAAVVVNHNDRHQTRLNASIATVDDQHTPGTDTVKRQVAVAHSAKLQVGEVDLSLTPGVAVAEATSPAGETTVGPTLAVEARHDRQRLALEIGQSELDAADPAADVEQKRLGLSYEVQRGQHSFGFDVEQTTRQPAVGEETEAWRAGMYWRYDLGKDLSGSS
jgi:hypothetical protein